MRCSVKEDTAECSHSITARILTILYGDGEGISVFEVQERRSSWEVKMIKRAEVGDAKILSDLAIQMWPDHDLEDVEAQFFEICRK